MKGTPKSMYDLEKHSVAGVYKAVKICWNPHQIICSKKYLKVLKFFFV